MQHPTPFLKWVGGKNRLLGSLLNKLPTKIDTYHEPFIGGGALFLRLASEGRFRTSYISDANEELVNCYWVVRDSVDSLVKALSGMVVNEETYYAVRRHVPEDPVLRAARVIYLNKTGFNGLYRVNKKGEFNVPYGHWKKPPQVFDESNLRAVSKILRGSVSIQHRDYSEASKDMQPGHLAYFDPPYVPVDSTADFTSYTASGFGPRDQKNLANLCGLLVASKVKVMVSNSDTEVTRSLYPESMYTRHEIQVNRTVSCKGSKRGSVGELIVTSWQHDYVTDTKPTGYFGLDLAFLGIPNLDEDQA